MSAPRAAVDVGSNSVRLLVVDATGRRLVRRLTITRLGAGVDRAGRLDDAALERTLATIEAYRDEWRAHGVERVRIAATSAVRDAEDRHRFFDAVRALTGRDAEVLTGREEAELAFAGAVGAVTTPPGPVLVVDIGGGSTELVTGDHRGAVAGSVSLQLGCVRLAERLLPSDPPTDAEIAAARRLVDEQLDVAEAELAATPTPPAAARALVAVAGTATTLAALHAGLDAYEEERIHGTRVPAAALAGLAAWLLAMPTSERARLGPVQPGREDVIHAGALILTGIVERIGLGEVVVSEADGLDGLVASLD